jgi:hypothetical protein
MFGRRTLAIALPLAFALSSTQASVPKAAVFDFEMVDTSLRGTANGPRADEEARPVGLSDELRRRLLQSGRVKAIDIAPIATPARASNLQACGGCDAGFARELGAKYSLTGWIQRVSNLILNLNIVVRDAETGKVTWSKSVDMRGYTEESWSRSLDYLLRNYLFALGQGAFL